MVRTFQRDPERNGCDLRATAITNGGLSEVRGATDSLLARFVMQYKPCPPYNIQKFVIRLFQVCKLILPELSGGSFGTRWFCTLLG
ncbi:hypothetical protein [Rhodopirellula baltica]|nr:hypothetical protein [Rhodopirellula baltica]